MPGVSSYANEQLLIDDVKSHLKTGMAKTGGQPPQILVIGALGRCGKGALDAARVVGVPETSLLKWDMAETAKGGPFVEIVESSIFVNCIYLDKGASERRVALRKQIVEANVLSSGKLSHHSWTPPASPAPKEI